MTATNRRRLVDLHARLDALRAVTESVRLDVEAARRIGHDAPTERAAGPTDRPGRRGGTGPSPPPSERHRAAEHPQVRAGTAL